MVKNPKVHPLHNGEKSKRHKGYIDLQCLECVQNGEMLTQH